MAVLLTIIAFISTSLAIKVQYLILAAIGLSLFSIFAGFFLNTGINPSALYSAQCNRSFHRCIVRYFFPGCNRFYCGSCHVGRFEKLQNSIPRGTLLAIFTGLIIYLSLAIGFGFLLTENSCLRFGISSQSCLCPFTGYCRYLGSDPFICAWRNIGWPPHSSGNG
jgi:hypothetical protein